MRNLTRCILTIALIITTTVAHSATPNKASVMLNSSLKVEATVIRLGDLFTNAGEQSDVPVAYAPEPGKRVSFDARWLYRVARSHRLNWRPINNRVRAVVVRDSRIIGRDEIKMAIRGALADQGIAVDADIELFDQFIKLHVPSHSLSGVSVIDIEHDPRNFRFSAIISAPANSPDARQLRLRGRIHKTLEIPVLLHRISSGEEITNKDIKWIKIRAKRLQQNTVINEAELVGMTPKRSIRPGYPILVSSIRRPILVAKGSLVTMFLQAPQMVLTAQGKALRNGSDGDIVPISNLNSNKVVEAEIIGHGKVVVRPMAQLAMK